MKSRVSALLRAPFSDRRLPTNGRLRTSFQLLWWEGAFAIAYDSWIGPTYLSGLAGELGVSIGLVTFMAAIPWIGAVGPLLGAWIHSNGGSVGGHKSLRRSTLLFASISRSLWLLPLLLALLWTITGPMQGDPFPTQRWFKVTAVIACLAALSGTSGGATWLSWLRGIVPSKFRGRFFGVRHRYVMGATLVAHFLAAAWISWKPRGFYLGYASLGILALASAALSTFLLSKVPDAQPEDSTDPREAAQAPLKLSAFLEPFQNRKFRGVLIFGALFHGAIQLAGPYYPYYFTKELHIPMALVATWIMLNSAGAFVAASFWGQRIDRMGNVPQVLRVTAVLASLCPLPYVFASAQFVRWMAPFEYFANGLYWCGYQLAITTLLLQMTPPGRNVTYFSVYTACAGISAAIGSFLGGSLAHWLAPWGGFRALWLIASGCRFFVIWACFRLVTDRREPDPSAMSPGPASQPA